MQFLSEIKRTLIAGSRAQIEHGHATGHITVNAQPPSNRFHRFVDEEIKTWIHQKDLDRAPVDYEISFFEEDALGEVSCLVVVHSEDHVWRSWQMGDNPRMALSRGLESLDTTSNAHELPMGKFSEH